MNYPETNEQLIRQALAEDDTENDVTTFPIVPSSHQSTAILYARESGVIAGLSFVEAVFCFPPSALKFNALVKEGVMVKPDQPIAQISGSTRTLLTRERVALNFLQRCSGIATLTRQFIEKIAHTSTQLLDTRKTTPGLRVIEKHAVRVGGGRNHRFSLSEMVLIKDNHIAVAGSITQAVNDIRASSLSTGLLIEVETCTMDEVREALACNPDRIMLDNMNLSQIKEALSIIQHRVEVEVSGGITLDRIGAIAELGVDYISTGAITHSAVAMDISMEIEK